MADLEKATRTRLLAHAGTAALVGTSKRVYYSVLPADPTLPAVTVQEISTPPVGAMGDDTGMVGFRIQVDSWATTRTKAKSLGEQVRDALQRWRGTSEGSEMYFTGMNGAGVRYESEGRIWRHRQDFEGFFTEA